MLIASADLTNHIEMQLISIFGRWKTPQNKSPKLSKPALFVVSITAEGDHGEYVNASLLLDYDSWTVKDILVSHSNCRTVKVCIAGVGGFGWEGET